MTAAVEEVAPWSRLRWAATISFVVGIQLVLVLAFSNPPGTQPRQAPAAQVTLPKGMAPELQSLTDPTLLALGGPQGFSAIWLTVPELKPLQTDWQQPPQWLGLESGTLGERFLAFAQSNASALHGLAFKSQPQTVPVKPRVSPQPLRTKSTLRAAGDLAGRTLLIQPDLPSWPSKTLLVPSEVRVMVDARGLVTSAILQSGSGSTEADKFAVAQARQVRFSPLPHKTDPSPLTLGRLVFEWQTKPEAPSTNPVKRK